MLVYTKNCQSKYLLIINDDKGTRFSEKRLLVIIIINNDNQSPREHFSRLIVLFTETLTNTESVIFFLYVYLF